MPELHRQSRNYPGTPSALWWSIPVRRSYTGSPAIILQLSCNYPGTPSLPATRVAEYPGTPELHQQSWDYPRTPSSPATPVIQGLYSPIYVQQPIVILGIYYLERSGPSPLWILGGSCMAGGFSLGQEERSTSVKLCLLTPPTSWVESGRHLWPHLHYILKQSDRLCCNRSWSQGMTIQV